MKLTHLIISFIGLSISGLFLAAGVAKAEIPPTDPEVMRIEALPGGSLGISLTWTKNPEANESAPDFGYIIYYGDSLTTITRIMARGQFPESGPASRQHVVNDVICELNLPRISQDFFVALKAFSGTSKSGFSQPVSVFFTAQDVQGICNPKGLTVTVSPAPLP